MIKVIIVNLKGGLGNQMFQYALGYCLAKKKGVHLCLDLRLMEEHKIKPSPRNVPRSFDLDIFNIEEKIASKIDLIKTMQFMNSHRLRKYTALILDKLNLFIIYEKNRLYDNRVYSNNSKNIYLDGLWQSENYFKNFRKEILNLYNFDKINKKEKNIEFIKKIDLSKSICLNVRRTDFLNNSEHNVVSTKYYVNAITRFKEIIGPKFKVYIFSDDLEWCKENLQFIDDKEFVEHEYAGYKFYDYLYLMSSFKNFIIPNSSFAWWACWLSKQKNKNVVTPKKWSGLVDESLIDVVPSSWIRIKY
ncbi:alpha-1,2-fucosyltransferase [Candidatus Pelagibacter sp.]|nr:alpha-1,2-fucosyltransferase [Candidatus Pelagibacter sp.]